MPRSERKCCTISTVTPTPAALIGCWTYWGCDSGVVPGIESSTKRSRLTTGSMCAEPLHFRGEVGMHHAND